GAIARSHLPDETAPRPGGPARPGGGAVVGCLHPDGLRYEQALIQKLLQGVMAMKESVTYQAIIEKGMAKGLAKGLAKGELEEARKILLLLGRSHLGEPSSEAIAAVNAVTDVQKLEELTVRLLRATSWHELLGLNGPGRRGRGRKKTS